MPEIAEVRVVANTLKKPIINRRILKTRVIYKGIIENDIDEFINTINNLQIQNISTFGKYIIFNLGEYSLISHLRMEGKYYYVESNKDIEKHTHVIFQLDNGYDLRYNDTRKFGKMKIVKTNMVFKDKSLIKLGLEPDNNKLSGEYLYNKIHIKHIPIKTILLDQGIINGLGNIYANEVLFYSKINPLKLGKDLTLDECNNIVKNSKEIIIKSYKMGGCTIRSYTSSLGVIGHFQDELKVHMQSKCSICNSDISKLKINGRSTYMCPKCQK